MHFKSSNPEPPHLPLICKGDRREVLIKVIKRTNLNKSAARFFLEGRVEVLVCVEKKKSTVTSVFSNTQERCYFMFN